jgi:hypothetical protein
MTEQPSPTIPLAVGSDFEYQPVRANFPDQKNDPWATPASPEKIIGFTPDPPNTSTESKPSWLDSTAFSGHTNFYIDLSIGDVLAIAAVIAIAMALIAKNRGTK